MAIRKNNTYKYETGKTFKLSRSGIEKFHKVSTVLLPK